MTPQTVAKKKNKRNVAAAREESRPRRSVEAELAQIAGLEKASSRDPVHHLIEHSRGMFDLLGRVNAEKMMDPERDSFDAVNKELSDSGAKGKHEQALEDSRSKSGGGSENDTQEDGGMETGEFYRRFSETAFTKGKLMCAVEQGGGKMMLTSCIRRTVDQSPPTDSRQSDVRERGATRMRVPDSRASLSYHKFTRGALSLVVETAQNLTKTLETMERMASGDVDDRLGLPDIDTASRMYPFLNTRPEKQKLESYREQLRGLPDGDKKRALEYGINRLNTIIDHKNRMRVNFLFELRKLLDDSRRAAELFSQPAVGEEILENLLKGAEGDPDDEKGNEEVRSEKRRGKKQKPDR